MRCRACATSRSSDIPNETKSTYSPTSFRQYRRRDRLGVVRRRVGRDDGAVALYGSARCGRLYKDEARRLIRARREAEEERAARFRELYAMLGLQVVCHRDHSLEVTLVRRADHTPLP